MHAVVLAAGFGERLGDLSKKGPKALLPLGRVTVLDVVVTALWVEGVSCIHVVHNRRWSAAFKRWQKGLIWVPRSAERKDFPFLRLHDSGAIVPDDRRGSVGDLAWVLAKMKRLDGVLVACGDNVHEFSASALEVLRGETSAISVRSECELRPAVVAGRPSWVQVEAGKVSCIEDQEPDRATPWRFCGPAYLSAQDCKRTLEFAMLVEQAGIRADSLGALFDWLSEEGEVRAVKLGDHNEGMERTGRRCATTVLAARCRAGCHSQGSGIATRPYRTSYAHRIYSGSVQASSV